MVNSTLQTRLQDGLEVLTKNLEKNNGNPFTIEQYKLLLSASQKNEERKKDVHSFFITANAIFLPFLINFYNASEHAQKSLVVFVILTGVGVILCLDWLWIIITYQKINYVNYALVSAFENYLPTSIFSLKDAIIEPRYEFKRANILTQKEAVIPFLFLCVYLIYFFIKTTSM